MNMKVILGAALLVLSAAMVFTLASIETVLPYAAGSIAAIGFILGSLLLGTSTDGRPV